MSEPLFWGALGALIGGYGQVLWFKLIDWHNARRTPEGEGSDE